MASLYDPERVILEGWLKKYTKGSVFRRPRWGPRFVVLEPLELQIYKRKEAPRPGDEPERVIDLDADTFAETVEPSSLELGRAFMLRLVLPDPRDAVEMDPGNPRPPKQTILLAAASEEEYEQWVLTLQDWCQLANYATDNGWRLETDGRMYDNNGVLRYDPEEDDDDDDEVEEGAQMDSTATQVKPTIAIGADDDADLDNAEVGLHRVNTTNIDEMVASLANTSEQVSKFADTTTNSRSDTQRSFNMPGPTDAGLIAPGRPIVDSSGREIYVPEYDSASEAGGALTPHIRPVGPVSQSRRQPGPPTVPVHRQPVPPGAMPSVPFVSDKQKYQNSSVPPVSSYSATVDQPTTIHLPVHPTSSEEDDDDDDDALYPVSDAIGQSAQSAAVKNGVQQASGLRENNVYRVNNVTRPSEVANTTPLTGNMQNVSMTATSMQSPSKAGRSRPRPKYLEKVQGQTQELVKNGTPQKSQVNSHTSQLDPVQNSKSNKTMNFDTTFWGNEEHRIKSSDSADVCSPTKEYAMSHAIPALGSTRKIKKDIPDSIPKQVMPRNIRMSSADYQDPPATDGVVAAAAAAEAIRLRIEEAQHKTQERQQMLLQNTSNTAIPTGLTTPAHKNHSIRDYDTEHTTANNMSAIQRAALHKSTPDNNQLNANSKLGKSHGNKTSQIPENIDNQSSDHQMGFDMTLQNSHTSRIDSIPMQPLPQLRHVLDVWEHMSNGFLGMLPRYRLPALFEALGLPDYVLRVSRVSAEEGAHLIERAFSRAAQELDASDEGLISRATFISWWQQRASIVLTLQYENESSASNRFMSYTESEEFDSRPVTPVSSSQASYKIAEESMETIQEYLSDAAAQSKSASQSVTYKHTSNNEKVGQSQLPVSHQTNANRSTADVNDSTNVSINTNTYSHQSSSISNDVMEETANRDMNGIRNISNDPDAKWRTYGDQSLRLHHQQAQSHQQQAQSHQQQPQFDQNQKLQLPSIDDEDDPLTRIEQELAQTSAMLQELFSPDKSAHDKDTTSQTMSDDVSTEHENFSTNPAVSDHVESKSTNSNDVQYPTDKKVADMKDETTLNENSSNQSTVEPALPGNVGYNNDNVDLNHKLTAENNLDTTTLGLFTSHYDQLASMYGVSTENRASNVIDSFLAETTKQSQNSMAMIRQSNDETTVSHNMIHPSTTVFNEEHTPSKIISSKTSSVLDNIFHSQATQVSPIRPVSASSNTILLRDSLSPRDLILPHFHDVLNTLYPCSSTPSIAFASHLCQLCVPDTSIGIGLNSHGGSELHLRTTGSLLLPHDTCSPMYPIVTNSEETTMNTIKMGTAETYTKPHLTSNSSQWIDHTLTGGSNGLFYTFKQALQTRQAAVVGMSPASQHEAMYKYLMTETDESFAEVRSRHGYGALNAALSISPQTSCNHVIQHYATQIERTIGSKHNSQLWKTIQQTYVPFQSTTDKSTEDVVTNYNRQKHISLETFQSTYLHGFMNPSYLVGTALAAANGPTNKLSNNNDPSSNHTHELNWNKTFQRIVEAREWLSIDAIEKLIVKSTFFGRFMSFSKSAAERIIQELGIPNKDKTIKLMSTEQYGLDQPDKLFTVQDDHTNYFPSSDHKLDVSMMANGGQDELSSSNIMYYHDGVVFYMVHSLLESNQETEYVGSIEGAKLAGHELRHIRVLQQAAQAVHREWLGHNGMIDYSTTKGKPTKRLPPISTPLMSVVDFYGFRMYGMTMIPDLGRKSGSPTLDSARYEYTNSGESYNNGMNGQTLVHGRYDHQSTFQPTERSMVSGLLRRLGKILNLKQHSVPRSFESVTATSSNSTTPNQTRTDVNLTGVSTTSSSSLSPMSSTMESTALSMDVQIHLCSDKRYYVLNASHLFPWEERLTSSKSTSSRCSDARRLRPELVIQWPKRLDADVYRMRQSIPNTTIPTQFTTQIRDHETDVTSATHYMTSSLLRIVARGLDTCSLLPCDSREFTWLLHSFGINMRHLGLLSALVTSEHAKSLLYVEMIARCGKHILARTLRRTCQSFAREQHTRQRYTTNASGRSDYYKQSAKTSKSLNNSQILQSSINSLQQQMEASIIEFFTLMMGNSEDARIFWQGVVIPHVKQTFNVHLPWQDSSVSSIGISFISKQSLWYALQHHCSIYFMDNSPSIHSLCSHIDQSMYDSTTFQSPKSLAKRTVEHIKLLEDSMNWFECVEPCESSQLLCIQPSVKSINLLRSMETDVFEYDAEQFIANGKLDAAYEALQLRLAALQASHVQSSWSFHAPTDLHTNQPTKDYTTSSSESYHTTFNQETNKTLFDVSLSTLRGSKEAFEIAAVMLDIARVQFAREQYVHARQTSCQALQYIPHGHILAAKLVLIYAQALILDCNEREGFSMGQVARTIAQFHLGRYHPMIASIDASLASSMYMKNSTNLQQAVTLWKRAISTYESCVVQQSHIANLYETIGLVHVWNGQTDFAMTYLEQAHAYRLNLAVMTKSSKQMYYPREENQSLMNRFVSFSTKMLDSHKTNDFVLNDTNNETDRQRLYRTIFMSRENVLGTCLGISIPSELFLSLLRISDVFALLRTKLVYALANLQHIIILHKSMEVKHAGNVYNPSLDDETQQSQIESASHRVHVLLQQTMQLLYGESTDAQQFKEAMDEIFSDACLIIQGTQRGLMQDHLTRIETICQHLERTQQASTL